MIPYICAILSILILSFPQYIIVSLSLEYIGVDRTVPLVLTLPVIGIILSFYIARVAVLQWGMGIILGTIITTVITGGILLALYLGIGIVFDV